MRTLLDTNVLCRLATEAHPFHFVAQNAISRLIESGHELCIVPQNLYEYWYVATRPVANNGLGVEPADAATAVDRWISLFKLLQDERDIFEIWRELVTTYRVQGKAAHDARLVAAMRHHQVTSLLTFNGADFARFDEIDILDPNAVAA